MPEVLVHEIDVAQTRALRRAVLRPHQSIEQMAREEPAGVLAAGAFAEGWLVAVGLVAPDGEPGGWRIRGMATAPERRGKGLGAQVLDALLAHAVAMRARRVWCNARTPARSFYERAGLRVISEEFHLPDIGPHFVMELRFEDEREHISSR
jgi:ribosomal protein S18 acetylase RimI-like enzyme